ncbi:MAG: DUF4097 family beta strand repeat-containing protein [Gemmatimonadales bacterium]
MFLSVMLLASAVLPVQGRDQDFQWRGRIAQGKTLEIVGINGSIEAAAATGAEAEVRATKSARRSDPDEVTIEVVEHADGITICAIYPNRRGRENECRPEGKGRNESRNNDTNVHWTIRVPQGVRFAGRTVNGDVSARGLTAFAEARSVNGSITVETTSWAEASTVNGSIEARLGRANWTGDLEFSSVNGSITITLPDAVDLEVDASTVNGGMTTDFPLTVKGRWGPRRMSGTIGQGGRSLSLSSVNGDMTLRRGR